MEFYKNCFYSNITSSSKEELLSIMSQQLVKNKLVSENYYDKIMEREEKYPTGIQAEVEFAMPHTDPEYVIKDSISVAFLNKPVMFHNMSEPELIVPVKIVFLLAFSKGEKHLEALQKIVQLATDAALIKKLLDYDEEKQYEFLNEYFKNN